MIYDVVIIGSGPAGYTAALYTSRANLSTLVMERLTPGGIMGTTDWIDNYPGFAEGISGFDLSMQMKAGAERFGTKTKLAEVKSVSLDGDIKKVETNKETIEARSLILANGSHPRELGLPKEAELRGKGVSYCATCDGMFYKGKTVAVVGGGNTAVEDAMYLAKICEKVYLIHRRDQFRASAVYTGPLKSTPNIELVLNSQVTELIGQEKLTGLKVHDKVKETDIELDVDGMFVAVGNLPNSELYKGVLQLDDQGYVVADETTCTGIPGVFVIGDLRAKPLRQIVTATSDGAVASKFVEEYLVSIAAKETGG